jgi:hypothetical protein
MNIKVYNDRLEHYLEVAAVVSTIAGAMSDYNSMRVGRVYRAKGGGFTADFDRADGGIVAEWSNVASPRKRSRKRS